MGLFASLLLALTCILSESGVTGVGGLTLGSRIEKLKRQFPQTRFLGSKPGCAGQYWSINDDLSVLAENGRVDYIIVGTGKFQVSGIRVGDPSSKVEKLHGECFELQIITCSTGLPEQFGLRYPKRNLMFWTGDGLVTRIVIGDMDNFRYSTRVLPIAVAAANESAQKARASWLALTSPRSSSPTSYSRAVADR